MNAWRLITLLAGTAIVLACAIVVVQRAWRRRRDAASTSVSVETLRRLRGEDDE